MPVPGVRVAGDGLQMFVVVRNWRRVCFVEWGGWASDLSGAFGSVGLVGALVERFDRAGKLVHRSSRGLVGGLAYPGLCY